MGYMNERINSESASANTNTETGGQLRVRLGVEPRTFQKRWKRTFGYSFDSRRIVTSEEVAAMEGYFFNSVKEDVSAASAKEPVSKRSSKRVAQPSFLPEKVGFARVVCCWMMFLVPTAASIRNTVTVSTAFSGDHTTALLITGTVSLTGIFWILSKKTLSWGDILGVVAFQGFEAFSNMAQIFKTLMGSMSYGVSVVSGEPSQMLDMVASVTMSDHRDTAVCLSSVVSLFILAAQVKGLVLIKNIRK